MDVYGFRLRAGNNGFDVSQDIFFPPALKVAQAHFSFFNGSGTPQIGISRYLFRPDPSGADQEVDFGDWPNWSDSVYASNIAGVTFSLRVDANQEVQAFFNIFSLE
jgi:hypothetical protein